MSAGRVRRSGITPFPGFLAFICLACAASLSAQQAMELPAPPVNAGATAQAFSFASDGPAGPGWSRPDEIARTYFHEELPALFRRTLVLSGDVPARSRLSWIFTDRQSTRLNSSH